MLPSRIFRLAVRRQLRPTTAYFSTAIIRRKDEVSQPHLPNRSSTLGDDVPKVGAANAPPEFLGNVDPNYKPLDAGSGEAKQGDVSGAKSAGGISGKESANQEPNEIHDTQWTSFQHEPLKREHEDEQTMRARLVYQSRKRGILETDLLLSTFADEHLPSMNATQMAEYDKFLDENDWDIYYWCTQEAPHDESENQALTEMQPTTYSSPSSKATASPIDSKEKIQPPAGALGLGSIEQAPMTVGAVSPNTSGEWAQTVGTVKQAYRPVPEKFKNSEIFKRLRDHVESRKASKTEGETGRGMGRMPDMKKY